MKLEWLGHASFLITDGKRIYIDPFQLEAGEPADLVFVTHPHQDHLELESLEKIVTPKTTIVCSADAHSKLAKLNPARIVMMKPGDSEEFGAVKVTATHAHNTDKEFHPKENEWLGFLITLDGMTIFHTGDLDDLEDLHGTRCDVLLVPVSGTYVMTADQAAGFAKEIDYKRAIPMHYGAIVGSEKDAVRFADLVENALVPTRGVDLLEGL